MTSETRKEASPETSVMRGWYVLYKVSGLRIVDEGNAALDDFCFPDATLFSLEALEPFIKAKNLNGDKVPANQNEDHEYSFLYMVRHPYRSKDEYDSFLVLKRDWPQCFGNADPKRTEEEARCTRRAREVSAALCLSLLLHSDKGLTCDLAPLVVSGAPVFDINGLHIESTARFHIGTRYTPRRYFPNLKGDIRRLSRTELGILLNHSELTAFNEIILRGAHPSHSLRRIVVSAATRLADSLHENSIAGRVLGAVTVLEMLTLGEVNSDYPAVARRIHALLGEESARFGLGEVFATRHAYVHRGESPIDGHLAENSVALALMAIIRFAEISVHFKDRESIANYLDTIGRIETSNGGIPWDKKTLLKSALLHIRRPSSLPFFGFVEPLGKYAVRPIR